MWAALNGENGVVKVLLEYGADIQAKDNDGQIITIFKHYFHNIHQNIYLNAKGNDGQIIVIIIIFWQKNYFCIIK